MSLVRDSCILWSIEVSGLVFASYFDPTNRSELFYYQPVILSHHGDDDYTFVEEDLDLQSGN